MQNLGELIKLSKPASSPTLFVLLPDVMSGLPACCLVTMCVSFVCSFKSYLRQWDGNLIGYIVNTYSTIVGTYTNICIRCGVRAMRGSQSEIATLQDRMKL